MTIARLVLVALVAAVAAASPSAVGRAAGNECAGVPKCISVPGPWVFVPAHGEATYLLECPRRRGVVGGLDSPVSSQDIRVTFDGLIASPIATGHTTTTYAFFRAVASAGKPGSFEPRIGCIPQSAQRVDTSARVVPIGAPLDPKAKTIPVRSGTVQTATLGCTAGEHLVSSWQATTFKTAEPPPPGLAAAIRVLRSTRAGKVSVTITTRDSLPADAKAAVQLGVECAGP